MKKSKKLLKEVKNRIRSRIKEHRRVRAGDLVPHELNFRLHPEEQKQALRGIYDTVGFARSLLAYESKGKLKLIDGHGRRELDPDMIVDVEVLDVTEEEAQMLLASIDPMAGLAKTAPKVLKTLLNNLPIGNVSLTGMWNKLAKDNKVDSEGLELNVNGDDADLTAEEVEIKSAHVKMFQLFLDVETHPVFTKWVKFMQERLGKNSPTETVYEVMRRAYKKMKKVRDVKET